MKINLYKLKKEEEEEEVEAIFTTSKDLKNK